MDFFNDVEQTVIQALAEDVGSGDLTVQLIDASKVSRAIVISRETAIVCGRPWVDEVFSQVDSSLDVRWLVNEGEEVKPGATILAVRGQSRSILTAERTALNFLQLLSGTATRTREYTRIVAGTGVSLLDTRKTIPGLRLAQKYAVSTGGAMNHRFGLFDAFLIKENHIAAAGSIASAIARARQINDEVRLEIEVESLVQLREAIDAGPDWIMLDNFTVRDMAEAVAIAQGTGIKLEASGGIESAQELLQIARTGVDYISIGALTKHCQAVDLSMRLEPE